MSVQFVDFKRTGEFRQGGWVKEKEQLTMLFCARAGHELEIIFLKVIGLHKSNIPTNETNKEGCLK